MKLFNYADENLFWCFELPDDSGMNRDFCFGGGAPTNFQMMDWAQAMPPGGEYDADLLKHFLLKKNYVKSHKHYLVLTNFGESFTFSGSERNDG